MIFMDYIKRDYIVKFVEYWKSLIVFRKVLLTCTQFVFKYFRVLNLLTILTHCFQITLHLLPFCCSCIFTTVHQQFSHLLGHFIFISFHIFVLIQFCIYKLLNGQLFTPNIKFKLIFVQKETSKIYTQAVITGDVEFGTDVV